MQLYCYLMGVIEDNILDLESYILFLVDIDIGDLI